MEDAAAQFPYLRVAQTIRDQIISGELAPGSRVPSVREIQAQFGVADGTASKALKVLSEEGLTETRARVGTIVRSQQPIYRRAEDRLKYGRSTGRFFMHGEASVIVEATIVGDVPGEVRAELDLEEDEPAIRRHRVTSRDGVPVEVSTSWFSSSMASIAPLLVGRESIEGGTTAYICRQLGKQVTHGMERQSVRLATDEEAAELGRSQPLPVMVTEHVASIGDEQICYEVGVCPPGYATVRTYNLT